MSAEFLEWAEKQSYKAEAVKMKKLILDDGSVTDRPNVICDTPIFSYHAEMVISEDACGYQCR